MQHLIIRARGSFYMGQIDSHLLEESHRRRRKEYFVFSPDLLLKDCPKLHYTPLQLCSCYSVPLMLRRGYRQAGGGHAAQGWPAVT